MVMETKKITCVDCNAVTAIKMAVSTADELVYASCTEDNYSLCECGGTLTHTDDLNYIKSKKVYVFTACYYIHYRGCYDCGGVYHHSAVTNALVSSGYHGDICATCLERYYTPCEICGVYVPTDIARYYKHNDRWICADCHEHNSIIQEYHDGHQKGVKK